MKDRFEFDLFVQKAEEREGRPFLTIYATDTAEDQHKERCSRTCLERMQDQIKRHSVDLLNSHHDAVGMGKAVDSFIVDAGQFDSELNGETALLVDVELDPRFPQAVALHESAMKGEHKHKFSIGGRLNRQNPKPFYYERGKKVLDDVELDHITACRAPKASNQRTHIAEAVFKTLDMTEDDEVLILGDTEDDGLEFDKKGMGGLLPIGDRARPWDASGAVRRVRDWANANEKPNAKYGRAFLWHDKTNPDVFGAYKLPYADIVNGQLTAMPRGLFAAAAAVQGARGGVDIPAADRGMVQRKLASYYSKMRTQFDDANIQVPWAHEMAIEKVFGSDFFTVLKSLDSAYFEGETAPAGKGPREHTHKFTGRLNGESGTLIGMTTSWSAGERHAHMVDLVGKDEAVTAPASRGFNHTHNLEMPSVSSITEKQFDKVLMEAAKELPIMFFGNDKLKKLAEKAVSRQEPESEHEMDKDKIENVEAGAPVEETPDTETIDTPENAESEQAAESVTEPVETETPSEDDPMELTKEDTGILRKIVNAFRSDPKEDNRPLQDRIIDAADHITENSVSQDNFDEVAGASLYLLKRLTGLELDRDELAVKSARLLSQLEMIADKDAPVALEVETPESVDTGEPSDDVSKTTEDGDTPEDTETTPMEVEEMNAEELKAFGKELATGLVEGLTPAITQGVVDTFRKEGLLPAAKEIETETPAEAPKEAAPETTEAPKEETPKETQTPETPETETETPAETPNEVAKTKDVLDEILKTVQGLDTRITEIEGRPGPSRSIAGQDPAPALPQKKNNGIFAGALFRK